MQKLTDTLNDKLNKYSCTDAAWVQFIRDHYTTIREQSQLVTITREDQLTYRFRFREFLTDKGYDPEAEWILMWLNQIASPQDFDGVSDILVPPISVIASLRSAYDTTCASTAASSAQKEALKLWY